LAAQPIVIKELRPPVKIIGDLMGQYQDLMRFFDIWKGPSDTGDIHAYDYLFLGNYVDKGQYSLEVICLLFALKLKYPKQIMLLRGNHEDKHVNKYLGFGDECAKRLGEDINDPNSVFMKINEAFEQMPLAAIISDKQ
jgi:protein phosphatase